MPIFIVQLIKCLITILGDIWGLSVKETVMDIRLTLSRIY